MGRTSVHRPRLDQPNLRYVSKALGFHPERTGQHSLEPLEPTKMGISHIYSQLDTLCESVTAKHMLSNCVVAHKSGPYKWRHDNVLRVIYPDLVGLVNAANHSTPKSRSSICRQPFVRAGAKPPAHKGPQPVASLLNLANDWILLVDDVPRRTIS